MRFLILIKATPDSESAVMPKESPMTPMVLYHEEPGRLLAEPMPEESEAAGGVLI